MIELPRWAEVLHDQVVFAEGETRRGGTTPINAPPCYWDWSRYRSMPRNLLLLNP